MCEEKYRIRTEIGGRVAMSLTTITVYPLTMDAVNAVVPDGIIGNYRKGRIEHGYFNVVYVGRTDEEPLKERLLVHARKHEGEGLYFHFREAKDAKDAYEKECYDYHLFGGKDGKLANKIHPDKPNETDYTCPICKE